MNEIFYPKQIVSTWCSLRRADPYQKCSGCIMLGEEHDMGATIPYCKLCNDFWQGVQRCEEPSECLEKTGLAEVRRYILENKGDSGR